jgi:acyl-CoA reductase-like NAD-dependent aldehyde dehydrogenase
VQEGIYDEFVKRFIASSSKIIVGDPMDPKTMMGPLAYAACRDTAERFIKGAKAAGAKVLLGGERPTSPDTVNGAFVMPTIFEVYDNSMELMQEEIFAPVVGVMKVKTPEEAAKLTNESRYGLCASVWSSDYRKAMLLTEELKVGTAWVNQHLAIVSETPWGGQKESGWTKENSILVLDEYTYHKHLWVNMAETPNTFWKEYIAADRS